MNSVTRTGDLASLCLRFSIPKVGLINLCTSFIRSFILLLILIIISLNKHLLSVRPGPRTREELTTTVTQAASPVVEIKPRFAGLCCPAVHVLGLL